MYTESQTILNVEDSAISMNNEMENQNPNEKITIPESTQNHYKSVMVSPTASRAKLDIFKLP
jgi:hypothetical protein